MKDFPVPRREDVSPANQTLFDNLEKAIGYTPNLFATLAHSDYALGNYLTFQNSKTSLRAKEREVINLVVSQLNNCVYCLSAHSALAEMNGFTDEQILEIRRAEITFDARLDALARLVKSIIVNNGHAEEQLITNFYQAGYTKGSLMDVLLVIGDKFTTNFLHAVTKVPVDWPLARPLETDQV